MSLFFSSPYLVFPGFVFRSYSALPRLSTRLPSSLSLHCPFPPSSLEHQSTSMTRPSKSSPTPRLRLWRGESLTDSQVFHLNSLFFLSRVLSSRVVDWGRSADTATLPPPSSLLFLERCEFRWFTLAALSSSSLESSTVLGASESNRDGWMDGCTRIQLAHSRTRQDTCAQRIVEKNISRFSFTVRVCVLAIRIHIFDVGTHLDNNAKHHRCTRPCRWSPGRAHQRPR